MMVDVEVGVGVMVDEVMVMEVMIMEMMMEMKVQYTTLMQLPISIWRWLLPG